jgi:rhodanese-related sulfurtransferase/predicted DsbA family dithiol-disulfide isomerase
MIEYSDFQCPYCRRYATETLPALVQQYVDSGQLRVEWHDFPAQGPVSVALAVAGRAAEQQGMFWDFHEAAFGNTARITDDTQIRALAEQAGLDLEAFDAAIQDPMLELAVRRDYAEGQTRGVTGTPAFLVNGRAVRGAQPLQVFQQLIESELTGEPIPTKRTADPVHLSPEDAAALLADPPEGLQVVDVRTSEEIATGTVMDRSGLIELDFYADTFGNDLMATLDPNEPVFVYCRSGNRSGQTVEFLADQGFPEVYDLDGGIVAWQEAGLPLS